MRTKSVFFITLAHESDLMELSSLAKRIWEQHFTPIIGESQVAYMVDKFQSHDAMKRQITNEGYTYYQLLEEDTLVGFMGVVYGDSKTLLSKLYLHESARGKGYASQALSFLENECKKRSCDIIWLTCNKENEKTLKQYAKMGFEIFDSVVNDIGEGYVMDDYYLKKTL